MADAPVDVRATLGALLVGGLVCTFLSGAVSIQAYQYARTSQKDFIAVKILVVIIWTLDIFHTALVGFSNWEYLVASFGNPNIHNTIIWSLGVTVAVTAVLTFCVHCFFVHRLYKLLWALSMSLTIATVTKGKLWLAGPIAVFALFRMASACVTCGKMIELGTFPAFFEQIRWVFTLGLCLSTGTDVTIAISMCYFLWNSRTGASDLDAIIDSVILYTIENGILTSIATIASLCFWLASPHTLVYMGLHFAISKLYASSLLASLNARKTLRQAHASVIEGQRPSPPSSPRRFSRFSVKADKYATRSKLEISVEKTVDYVVDDESSYTPGYQMEVRSMKNLTERSDSPA